MEKEEDIKEGFKIDDLVKKSNEETSLSELVSKRLDELYSKEKPKKNS